MSKANVFASIHVIGLGGTGANVIQTLIESERLARLLATEDFRIACLALDVADGDLVSLQASYKEAMAKLEEKGIGVDRLWLKPLNIKFNTPDALFEFMEKYSKYLEKDGVTVNDYRPWIQSSMSIPPLAGGVGRQRALSKAVYALNYYHYVELNSVMSVYKDRVLTSKYQPIVLLVFGLGGGTGSGLIFDFARHLRAKLGSAVPIVGLGILPSSADDLLARGPAPYATLMEAQLLFDREANERVIKAYGGAYRNPFTAMFFLPLDPVYNNKSSLLSAKKELDGAIVDIVHVMMNFDLADLLSRVGTNNDFGQNWVHNIAYLKIRYPLEDYLKYLHEYLKLLESVGSFVNLKRESLSQIDDVLKRRYIELVELFRRHLISINNYRPESFDAEVEDVIHRAGKYELEFKKQVKGIEDFAAYYNGKWAKALKAMAFSEDTVEYSVMQQIGRWSQDISEISRTYEDFTKGLAASLADVESSLTASKFVTSSQLRQIRSYINFVNLVNGAIQVFGTYLRTKALADELKIRFAKDQSPEGKRAVTVGETEVTPLFKTAGTILTKPETEIKMSDQYIPGVRVVRKNLESRFKEAGEEMESLMRLLAQKETEETRLKGELQKIRLDISGRRKVIRRHLESVKGEIGAQKTALEERKAEVDRLHSELDILTSLEKSLEVTSPYRKSLNSIVGKTAELNSMLSSISGTGSYFERVVELSDDEQEKILKKILTEEEASLKGEGILREIVDRDRFRDVVKSYMRIFSVSNYAGLNDGYRSDLIWATVGIPQGLWDQDLQVNLSSTLNIFSSVEASKSISIRQIPQVDPWTITFLIIFAKATVEQLEKFQGMRNDADGVRKVERVMFRSFLLEHGITDLAELISKLSGPSPRAKGRGSA